MADKDFSGVWLSSYSFHNPARDADLKSEHYVTMTKKGDTLIVQSIPEANTAYLNLRLHVSEKLATGGWQEQTSKDGFFKGAIFYGALQLLISDDKKNMKGKWVAYNSSGSVVANDWELTYVGPELPKDLSDFRTERPA